MSRSVRLFVLLLLCIYGQWVRVGGWQAETNRQLISWGPLIDSNGARLELKRLFRLLLKWLVGGW